MRNLTIFLSNVCVCVGVCAVTGGMAVGRYGRDWWTPLPDSWLSLRLEDSVLLLLKHLVFFKPRPQALSAQKSWEGRPVDKTIISFVTSIL